MLQDSYVAGPEYQHIVVDDKLMLLFRDGHLEEAEPPHSWMKTMFGMIGSYFHN